MAETIKNCFKEYVHPNVLALFDSNLENAAREIETWWDNAAADMGQCFYPNLHDADSPVMVHYHSLLQSGVPGFEAKESVADWFHSDVDTIVDCCGDRIYDETTRMETDWGKMVKSRDHIFIEICRKCKSNGMDSEAMDKLIERHSK